MVGRPKTYDENEILEKATNVFFLKGYSATTADDLLKAMNIGKGSFYLAFRGGKRELYQKTLRNFSDKAINRFRTDLHNAQNPIDFLKEFFFLLAESPLERKMKGCYIGNAIIEMSNFDVELTDQAIELLSSLEKGFKRALEAAKHKGFLKSNVDSSILSKYLINLWNGLNVSRRIYTSKSVLKEIIRMNLAVLD